MVAAALPIASSAAAGSTAGTHTSARIAKAQWRPDAAVRAITVSRTRVFIAGDFTHLRNTATGKKVRRAHLAAFNRSTGALIGGFHPRTNGSVDALAVLGPKLVLGGSFTSVNGEVRNHLGAVNTTTGGVSPWAAQVDGPVFTLLSMDGRIYGGGDFQHVNGLLRTHLFALDTHGVLSATWPNQAAGTTNKGVYTLAAAADHRSVIVGGSFDKLSGSPRTYLGEISTLTGDVTAWTPAPVCSGKCYVKSLTTDKSRVYAGVAGPGGEVIAYRSDTAKVVWKKHSNGDVTAIALAGKSLVLGGHFTQVNRRRHHMFAELRARDGKVLKRRPSSAGDPYPGVLAIDVHDHRIRLGGAFSMLAGQARFAIMPE